MDTIDSTERVLPDEGRPAKPPILFVHGLYHGGWCYEEHFVPWFRSRGYEAAAVTLRHHDQHHAPGLRVTSLMDYVADVVAAAARMSSPPVVIGHSMGGFVAQKYLEGHARLPRCCWLPRRHRDSWARPCAEVRGTRCACWP
jgi:alpha-beta hydrolase superfamily lysophospholipase